jgi:hypothetical protein
MSRSFRHTPCCAMTTAESEKDDKRRLNRAWRRLTASILHGAHHADDETLDALHVPGCHDEIMNLWLMDKDGRQSYWHRSDRPRRHGCRRHGRGFARMGDEYPRWPAYKAWGK